MTAPSSGNASTRKETNPSTRPLLSLTYNDSITGKRSLGQSYALHKGSCSYQQYIIENLSHFTHYMMSNSVAKHNIA